MTPGEEVGILPTENTTLREQLAVALGEIQSLKGQLPKDSRNGSKPLSSDGLVPQDQERVKAQWEEAGRPTGLRG